MNARAIEKSAGVTFLICFALVFHESRLADQDPRHWLPAPLHSVVAWLLLLSAGGYVAARFAQRRKAGRQSAG